MRPAVSVVVPTHNRARSLCRTLEALTRQTFGADRFEVLAVANGCRDDTAATVRARAWPFALQLVELPTSSMSAARNTGASMARGDLLLFVDDDVEPLPSFIEAHRRAHQSARDLVAVGPYLPPQTLSPATLLAERLWHLDAAFAASLTQWKGPLDWLCIIGGNVSMPKALFEIVGGFDNSLSTYGREDSEFAYRAQKAGARFVHLPNAGAFHHSHENRSLMDYFRKARSIGRNDVVITRRYPEIHDRLPVNRAIRPHTMLGRLARWFAYDHPRAGDVMVRGLMLAGSGLGALRMRRPWNRLVDCTYEYWYFRGVADELGNSAAVAAYIEGLRPSLGSDRS